MALQKPLRGLSDLLGLFRQGQVPIDWSGLVGMTLQAEQFLSEPTTESASSNVTAILQGVPITIPDDELWLVWNVSTYTLGPIAAGDSFNANVRAFWEKNTNGRVYLTASSTANLMATGSGSVFSTSQSFDRGMWVPPGANISSVCDVKSSGASVTLYLDVMYSKIRL